MAKVREGELAGLALDYAQVLGERSAGDLGRRRVPSPRLSVERLDKIIGKGYSGAPHNCIIASHDGAHLALMATTGPVCLPLSERNGSH
jgi:hypothetical protein